MGFQQRIPARIIGPSLAWLRFLQMYRLSMRRSKESVNDEQSVTTPPVSPGGILQTIVTRIVGFILSSWL